MVLVLSQISYAKPLGKKCKTHVLRNFFAMRAEIEWLLELLDWRLPIRFILRPEP